VAGDHIPSRHYRLAAGTSTDARSTPKRTSGQRSQKTISALNHAHICGLFDIGHQDGTDFLLMEYLEGETLPARLARAFEAATITHRSTASIDRVPASSSTR
jgi:serine/threonine protein kinase